MTLMQISRTIEKALAEGVTAWLVIGLVSAAASDAQQVKEKTAAGARSQVKAKPLAVGAPAQTPVKAEARIPSQEPAKKVSAVQEPANAQRQVALNERDAVKKALGHSRQLDALKTEVRVLEVRAGCTSCNLRNPEVRLADISTKYFYADPSVNKQFRVGLRWHPPKLGEVGVNKQREKVKLWEKKVDEDVYRRKLVAEVRRTYAELAFIEQSRDLVAQQTALEERRNTAVQRLVGMGQKALLDQIKGRRRLIKAREEMSKLSRRYLEAKSRLRELTGEKREITAAFTEPTEPVPDLQKLHAQAVKNRRDFALTEERAKLTNLRYSEARYAQIPWFSFIEADYHHESANLDWGELRFGIDLPLFSWGSAALDSTAMAKSASSQYQEATVESIDRNVSAALGAYQEALAEWQSLKAEAESFVPGTEGLVSQARQQPSVPISDVIDLEVSTIELRQMVLEARFDLAKASIKLCEAVGVDGWQDLGK
jgi:hypothetical protein